VRRRAPANETARAATRPAQMHRLRVEVIVLVPM
jgi:hypothetical protein